MVCLLKNHYSCIYFPDFKCSFLGISASVHLCSSGLDVRYNLISDVGAYYAARLLQVLFYYKTFYVFFFFQKPIKNESFLWNVQGFERAKLAKLAPYCRFTLETLKLKCCIWLHFIKERQCGPLIREGVLKKKKALFQPQISTYVFVSILS